MKHTATSLSTYRLLTRQRRSVALHTTRHTRLVTNIGPHSLGVRPRRRHVSIDVRQHISAAVLVDQIDVVGRGLTLLGHDHELVDDILEGTSRGESRVGSLNIGHLAVSGVDDGLVGELVDLGVVGDEGGLLEGGVVVDSRPVVQEHGDHGGVGLPVGDGSGEVTSGGGLTWGASRGRRNSGVGSRGDGSRRTGSGLGCSLTGCCSSVACSSGGSTGSSSCASCSSSTRGSASVGGSSVGRGGAGASLVGVRRIIITALIATGRGGSSNSCGGEKSAEDDVLHGDGGDVLKVRR